MEKGKEKFVKFLKSIHIEDDMDFDDMSFLNITKSILDKNTFIYIIEKLLFKVIFFFFWCSRI